MGSLLWDQLGDRLYETGISKCVLYKEDGYGVAWNGIISVDEDNDGEVDSVYFDGFKINDVVTLGDYSGIIRAYTYPDEFLFYEGILEDQTGFYVTHQPQSKFGLSYRTEIGNDVRENLGYKIHLLYNLTALPSSRTHRTLGLTVEPDEFEWSITSIPEDIENFRPTAHVIIDSLKMDPGLLMDIEEILYGTEETDARLPSLKGLATFIRKWDRLIITDNGDGTWTATSNVEGIIVMTDATTFEITSDTAEFIDADSYTIESSEKNEEDIWLP